MTTTSHRFFDNVLPVQTAARPVLVRAKTKATSPAPAMPASLWRHAQNEDAVETRHGRLAGQLIAGLAALGASGVACAIYQTCTLMTGSRLHDAITAFVR